VGWIFADYRAVPLLRVMCVAVAIDGLANVGVIYFRKDLQFHKQVIYDLVGALVALGTFSEA
jgi:O-antigen/teichoic acid export membrane protein